MGRDAGAGAAAGTPVGDTVTAADGAFVFRLRTAGNYMIRFGVRCDVFPPAATTMFFGQICLPTVVLDGVVLRAGGYRRPAGDLVDDLLNPFNIEAIEVYPSPAGVPVQYAGYLSPCGVIIAWTRR